MTDPEHEILAHTISHDLRAPLRAIDGYTRMVLDDEGDALSGEARKRLQQVLDSAEQLATRVDALAAYMRIAIDPAEFVAVDMAGVVGELVAAAEQAGRLSGCHVEVLPMPPARGDRQSVRELWSRLLDNALKFSAGTPEARIRVGAEEDKGGTVYFIADNGAGFDSRYAGKLFGLFKRLHYADEFPGVGAGLAFAHRIVAGHGGRIWAEGEPKAGATIRFTLPGSSHASGPANPEGA